MSRSTLGAVIGAFIFLTVGVAAAVAAPVQLVLPQSAAFAVLGHSCGGIQESTYATGFDPASGYPSGVVYLSTRCGGSGRGGGYHTTTYTAWAAVSWDFTATVISYGATTAPAVDPTLTAYDASGNEVYDQSGGAYLLLAPGFVPAPRVTSVSPASGPASGGTTVTISGTGFTGATGVRFGTTPARSFTVAGSTSITAVSPAAGGGTVDVTVANAGGASTTGTNDRFTFVAAPVVSSLSPSSGSVGGGTTVTITGANLAAATQVTFGGTPTGFWVTSDTSLTAISPAGEAAETVSVRVRSIGGTSATGAGSRFTYAVTTPVVSGVGPSSGPADGGTWVTITGTNLSAASEVDFGGVPAYFSVNDDTSLFALSPGGAAGTVDVTVSSFGSTSAVSPADEFTYLAAPTVEVVDPPNGSVDGGTTVAIVGTGFTTATEVDFGGVPAAFVVNDDMSITATSPPGAAGTVDVTVTSDGGTSAVGPGDAFTYA
ncbi:MAG TPA: IPT/TIG domain-containing protein [Gaiellaceae bacterium]|nr:IPT/TIG domain-containing protein [Gaiellaceae bacterium]